MEAGGGLEAVSYTHLDVYKRQDRYVRNREGSLLSIAGDGTRYVLKDWFLDRECDLKDNREIRLAASRLAMLHKSLRKVPFQEEWNMGSILIEPLETELERHNRELQRARNYIRGLSLIHI